MSSAARRPGLGNVISANGYDGIQIDYAGTSENEVLGNDIGTDATGTHALGNGRAGVYLWSGASGNVIGGDAGRVRQRHLGQPPVRRDDRWQQRQYRRG